MGVLVGTVGGGSRYLVPSPLVLFVSLALGCLGYVVRPVSHAEFLP